MIDQSPELLEARRRVALVEHSRPDLVRLATAVSLAVRVEPALVRQARLELEPDLGVATEAELWFSPLVSSYSPRALVLDPAVATVLRERLIEDRVKRRAARTIVETLHATAAPTIRLEEQVLYDALTGEHPEQIERQLSRALNTMEAEPERADALARWTVRAWRSLPLAARAGDIAGKLIARSRWRLRGGIDVGVELTARGIVVSEPPSLASHVIPLPPAEPNEPTLLRVRPADSDEPAEPITIERGTVATHRIQASRIDLSVLPGVRSRQSGVDIETADGRLLELRPAPTATGPSARLDESALRDIQGDILRAHNYRHAAYVCVTIECPPVQAQGWLEGLIEQVTTAETWVARKPASTMNVAFSAAGLAALGVPEPLLATFSDEFRQGMAARSPLLGDLDASDSSRWDIGQRSLPVHVLLTVKAEAPADIGASLAGIREGMESVGGLLVAYEQHASKLVGAREQFGFDDGFGQPAIEGAPGGDQPGGGYPVAGGRWRSLPLGEFILGFPDLDTLVDPQRRIPSAPADPLGRSGTYMVFRKLRQDVALFRRTLRDAAARLEPMRNCWRPRSWDGGATAPRSSSPPSARTRPSEGRREQPTISGISTSTSTASGVRSARTSGARTRATPWAGRGWTMRGY